jgi:F0F1-type ATP synthase epsilon subunit
MEFKIFGPEGSLIRDALWVELTTATGNFIVQEGHSPMIVGLLPGKTIIYCLSNGKQESFVPISGVAEITRNSVTLLLNQMPPE